MKRWLGSWKLATFVLLTGSAFAQNYTAISASNITDANGTKLASGQICFTGTDAFDSPISFMVGGGGTILRRAICFNVANGAITTAVNGGSVQVPNPANTSPAGITYRVQARDTLSNQLVLDYRKVVFSGGSFSLDSYSQTGIAVLPLTGGTVNGPLTVNGNLSVTGTFTPGSMGATTFNSTVNGSGDFQFQWLGSFNAKRIEQKLYADNYATCDGVADARTGIQSALTEASAAIIPTTVVFPDNKVCLVSSNPGGAQVFTVTGTSVGIGGTGIIRIGNSFGNYHILFNFTGALANTTIEGVTVDGNATNNPVNSDPVGTNERQAFTVSNGKNITFQNLKFVNGNDVQTIVGNTCNGCHIRGNSWSNYGVGGTFEHDSSEVYLTGTSGEVSGNTFTAAGLGVRTAIEVHQDSKTVTGNVVNNYRHCIITSANQTVAHDFNISNNTCANVDRGIYMWLVDGSYDGFVASGNVISINRAANPWVPVDDEAGIGTYVGSGNVSGTFSLKNATISGNTIRFVSDTLATSNNLAGISLTNNTNPLPMSNVTVSGNTIANPPCLGIAVEPMGNISTLHVTGNTILNPGGTNNSTTNCGTLFRGGISTVLVTGNTINGSRIDNNVVTDNQGSPTTQYGIVYFGVLNDGAGTGLMYDANTVNFTGTPPNGAQSYFLVENSSPAFRALIPNFTRSTSIILSIVNNQFPAAGARIYDPVTGRLYVNAPNNSPGVWWVSTESKQVEPTSGTYQQGDIVFNSLPTSLGFLGWINTVGGSPGTFVKFGPLSDSDTNFDVNLTNIKGVSYSTTSNCAVNSASPAACGAAAAGAVVIPTTTTSYTVNTTAVTSHSRIHLQPITFASDLPSTPTCVAPASGPITISALTAGTSFTIALPSTTGTACLQYEVEN